MNGLSKGGHQWTHEGGDRWTEVIDQYMATTKSYSWSQGHATVMLQSCCYSHAATVMLQSCYSRSQGHAAQEGLGSPEPEPLLTTVLVLMVYAAVCTYMQQYVVQYGTVYAVVSIYAAVLMVYDGICIYAAVLMVYDGIYAYMQQYAPSCAQPWCTRGCILHMRS